MALGGPQKETAKGYFQNGAINAVGLALWGALGVLGRLTRSWTGIFVLIAGLVYLVPVGSMIGMVTGTAGPIELLTGKLSALVVGPSTPYDVKPSRAYGDTPQERLNQEVELYLRKRAASTGKNPETLTLVGNARVVSVAEQADGNFRLEIDADIQEKHGILGLSTGASQSTARLLAVEYASDHSVVIYSSN